MSKKVSRKRKSAVSRLRPFWLLIVLVAIAGGAGGYYAATWPGFFPRHVTVSGNRVVSSQEIAERAHILRDVNVWLQNMRAASRRIEAVPYVKEADIYRLPPASVHISVIERAPYAVLQYQSGSVLVDRDLRVLSPVFGHAGLPRFVVGAGEMPPAGTFVNDDAVRRLHDDFDQLAQSHVAVSSLRFDKFGDLVATMHNGVRLLLGDDADLQKKAALIGPILSQVAAGGRSIAAVDLRAPTTPVVVYRR